MSYETKKIENIVRLDPNDPEWVSDGTQVCIYIEPIGFTADFCAKGIDSNNADHSAIGLPYLNDNLNTVSSQSSGGFYDKVYVSTASTAGVKLYLGRVIPSV